jgi:hypothetical protein
MTVEDLMECMLNLFNNTSKNLHEEYQRLSQVDMELSDLDHYLENHKLKSYEHAKVSKLRQEKRIERRNIKDNIDMIEVVQRFTQKYNAKLITGDIIQNLKEQRDLKKRQENPTYKYRTNILDRLEVEHEQIQKQENDN